MIRRIDDAEAAIRELEAGSKKIQRVIEYVRTMVNGFEEGSRWSSHWTR